MVHVVEHLPNKSEALSLRSSIPKKKKKINSSGTRKHFSPFKKVIILLLYWGYTVTFTKVLTIYRT
jgi:hypothetical protein